MRSQLGSELLETSGIGDEEIEDSKALMKVFHSENEILLQMNCTCTQYVSMAVLSFNKQVLDICVFTSPLRIHQVWIMLSLISPPLSHPATDVGSNGNGEAREAPNLTLLAEPIKILQGIGQDICFAGSFF